MRRPSPSTADPSIDAVWWAVIRCLGKYQMLGEISSARASAATRIAAAYRGRVLRARLIYCACLAHETAYGTHSSTISHAGRAWCRSRLLCNDVREPGLACGLQSLFLPLLLTTLAQKVRSLSNVPS